MTLRTLVRIPCPSYGDAKELALRLEADGYSVVRRRRTVIARTDTRAEGEALARKLQLGAEVVAGRGSRLRPGLALTLVAGLKRI
jgi:hypothetical protein